MTLRQHISRDKARQLVAQDERVESLETTERQLSTREEFASAIGIAWEGAQRRLLLIGQYLIQAKERLPHGEFEAMIAEDLPFGKGVVYQLRTVAAAVRSGRLPEDKVPRDVTAAHELVSLTDTELMQAEAAGLVRPNVPRAEVRAFRRQIRAAAVASQPETSSAPNTTHADELVRLRARLDDLDRERADILARIAALEARG
jgi:hypothetical protein